MSAQSGLAHWGHLCRKWWDLNAACHGVRRSYCPLALAQAASDLMSLGVTSQVDLEVSGVAGHGVSKKN